MKLNELELIQLFRQPGGAEFVRFCNEVIRATCWAHGVPQSEVSTTLRTDIPDGGVDTRIGRGKLSEGPSALLKRSRSRGAYNWGYSLKKQ